MTIQDRIERIIELPVPPERAWRALTSAAELSKWFDGCRSVDLRVGGIIDWEWHQEDSIKSVIEILEPPRHLAYRWRPGAYDPAYAHIHYTTLVEFILEPIATGTRLRLVESGFAALPEAVRAKALADNEGGWTEELADLVNYCTGA
ncbi:MAG: SRPBCC family protein [Caldilineaceae bacterium]